MKAARKTEVTRPRIFAISRDEDGNRATFTSANDGKQQLIADLRRIAPECMRDVSYYGMVQLLADRAARFGTLDAKRESMQATYARLCDGTFSLAERLPSKRLVMESVFVAGRALGKLFTALDDEQARKRWAESTELARLKFAALPDVAERVAADADVEEMDIEAEFA